MKKIPIIESLNDKGHAYTRPARYIEELPVLSDRLAALEIATKAISLILNVAPSKCIPFGVPVYSVFMTRPEAKKHAQHKLLMTLGGNIRLDLFCVNNNPKITDFN